MVKNNVALVPKSRKRYLGTTLKVRMDFFQEFITSGKKKKTVKVALILFDLFDTVT